MILHLRILRLLFIIVNHIRPRVLLCHLICMQMVLFFRWRKWNTANKVKPNTMISSICVWHTYSYPYSFEHTVPKIMKIHREKSSYPFFFIFFHSDFHYEFISCVPFFIKQSNCSLSSISLFSIKSHYAVCMLIAVWINCSMFILMVIDGMHSSPFLMRQLFYKTIRNSLLANWISID